MKKILYCVLCSFPFLVLGQNENDLFRFSKSTFQGDARFESMAGSFGALGANFGCSQINPAGFGRFSASQFGAGINISHVKNSSDFNGTTTDATKTPFKMGNLGLVLVNDKSEENRGFLYSQLGIGYNRIDNYTQNTHYQGRLYNSLLDGFTAQGAGVTPENLAFQYPFSTSLAWETYLINYDDQSSTYYSLLTQGDMLHDRDIEQKGGINEWYFSYSANYLNKLYLGVNLGLRSFNYTEKYLHKETLTDTVGTDLRSFDYAYNLKTKGNGANLKIGVIYLPTEALRLGLAVHSPTFAEMTDTWSADMNGYFQDTTYRLAENLKPSAQYVYKVRTPTRFVGSIAYVFGLKGCVNVDLEYVNYRWAFFRGTSKDGNAYYDFKPENATAKSVFQPALNLRVGGELLLTSNLFLRGGYALYPPAFKSEVQAELGNQQIYSAGIGFKTANFVIDLAYKYMTYERNYRAFPESTTRIKTVVNSFALSGAVLF